MPIALQPRQQGLFVLDLDIQAVDEDDGRGFAGIVTAAKDRMAEQFVGRNPQAFEDRTVQFAGGVIEWKFEFGQAHESLAIVGSSKRAILASRFVVTALLCTTFRQGQAVMDFLEIRML